MTGPRPALSFQRPEQLPGFAFWLAISGLISTNSHIFQTKNMVTSL